MPTKKDRPSSVPQSGLKIKPDEVEVTSEPSPEIGGDPEKIVRDRGLDPKDWEFTGMTVNEWDSPTGETLQQLKVQLKRKNDPFLLLPARTDGPKYKKPKKQKIDKDGSLFVFSGDDQAPFHDPNLEEKKLLFLEDVQPHTIVKIGDTNDFPTISRYKKNPETDEISTVQHCIDSGYELLSRERQAAPNAHIKKIIGNHDVRLRDFIIEWVPELHGLKRAQLPGIKEASIFSPEHLMRLDELGIELVGDGQNYEHGEIKISKYLAARHGWIATKGSGSSALKTLEHLGYSIIVGHTHRLSLVFKTMHDIDGDLKILAAAESGCLCTVDKKGLGYTPAPDWAQGFITAMVYPDGKFHIDVGNYINGHIYWRGNRY